MTPIIVLILAQLLDILTSIIAMKYYGTIEGNKLFFNNFLGLVPIKLGVMIPLTLAFWHYKQYRAWMAPGVWMACGGVFYVVIQNILVMGGR